MKKRANSIYSFTSIKTVNNMYPNFKCTPASPYNNMGKYLKLKLGAPKEMPVLTNDEAGKDVDARVWELFYKPDHKKRGVNANFVMCRVCYLDIHKPAHEDYFTTDYLLNHARDCPGTAKQFADVLKIQHLVYFYEQKVFDGNPKFTHLNDHLRKLSLMGSFKETKEQLATILSQSQASQTEEDDDNDVTVTNQTVQTE